MEQLDIKNFKRKDTYLTEDFPEKEYKSRTNEIKSSVHIGQIKLLLSEISFLTLFLKSKNPIVVYAGAAPGDHIPILSDLFPEIEFHLYDPSPFKIKENTKIKIYNQLFLDEDALKWSNKDNIYFISDIRTADYHTLTAEENEEEIINNMNMQKRWFEIINPVHALLKFRLPYALEQISKKYGPNIEYLDGYVFFQAFAGQSSTETRFVPMKDTRKLWNFKKYESQMFYFNSVIREKARYFNPFYGDETSIFGEGHVNDYDDRYMAQVIIDYLKQRLCISHTLVKSFYDVLMKTLFGKDQVIELRKKTDKSSGKQYYASKGFTKAFLFSTFNIDNVPPVSGVIFRILNNNIPYYLLNNNSYFPLFDSVPENKNDYLDSINKIQKDIFGDVQRDQKIFTLYNDNLLILLVNLPDFKPQTLNKFITEDKFSSLNPIIKQHMSTYLYYKTKLY
jgi:hypothetical protein